MKTDGSAAAGPLERTGAGEDRVKGPWWRRLWEGWKRVAEAIGNFNARVLLTVFYLVFVAPLALGLKVFADPLKLKRTSKSYWSPAAEQPHDMTAAGRQFS